MSKLFRSTVITVALLTACSKASPPAMQPPPPPSVSAIPAKVTTSDGVTRMSHDAADLERAPHFTVSAQPIAELGGEDDPKYDVTYAGYIAMLSDGTYATLSPIGSRFLIFDSTGKGVRMIGQEGQGPGDFMNPIALLAMPGDTLYVPDIANARANFVVPQSGKMTSSKLDPAVVRQLQPNGLLPGHRMVGWNRYEPEWTSDTVGRPLVPIGVAGTDGSMPHVIDSIPGLAVAYIAVSQRGRQGHFTVPVRFRNWPSVAAWDTLVAISRDDLGYHVQLRSAAGTLVTELVVDRPRRAVTSTMRNAQMDIERKRITAGGESGGSTMTVADHEKEVADTPTRDSLTQIHVMFTTSNQTLWVVDPIVPTDSSWTATAFALDGGIVGRLEVPGHDLPIAFGNDRAVVRHENESGLITLRVYRLIAPK